jgi:hypothetical protein
VLEKIDFCSPIPTFPQGEGASRGYKMKNTPLFVSNSLLS